jgi:hypothetical protein
MAKDSLTDFLERAGKWLREVAEEVERQQKPEPAQNEPTAGEKLARDVINNLRESHEVLLAEKKGLDEKIRRTKSRLQIALDRFHGNEPTPSINLPLDQVVEAAAKTIEGQARKPKGFPAQIVETNDQRVDSLRTLIRDLEAQQVADTRLIGEQAREIERLTAENRMMRADGGQETE